jgi:hypothetical protein
MRTLLLITAAVAAITLTGCNASSASLSCSGVDAALKNILAKKAINVLSVEDVVTKNHNDSSVDCEASLHIDRRIFGSDIYNILRISYNVSLTDESKFWVQTTGFLYGENETTQQDTEEQKKAEADAAAQQEAQQEAQAAKEKAAIEKEEADNKIDTTAACDEARIESALNGDLSTVVASVTLTNVVTVSGGVCVAYFVESVLIGAPRLYTNTFKRLDYEITMGGLKTTHVEGARQPFPDPVLTEGQQSYVEANNSAVQLQSHCGPNPSRHCRQRFGQ